MELNGNSIPTMGIQFMQKLNTTGIGMPNYVSFSIWNNPTPISAAPANLTIFCYKQRKFV